MSFKSDLSDRILRRLGYPMVKVELDPSQVADNIEYACNKFIQFAAGNATQETWFTIQLSAGQAFYDMPGGTVEVIGYSATSAAMGGINTLFTIQHMLYETGVFDALTNPQGGGYSLVSYHIARQFIKTMQRFVIDPYNFKYHKSANVLELDPAPGTNDNDSLSDNNLNSNDYLLVRSYMISGASLPSYQGLDSDDNELYSRLWVEDFATAKCKESLGYIRRKYASFSALGNQGMSLDGEQMISEGLAEQQRLLDYLETREVYEGWPIIIGSM